MGRSVIFMGVLQDSGGVVVPILVGGNIRVFWGVILVDSIATSLVEHSFIFLVEPLLEQPVPTGEFNVGVMLLAIFVEEGAVAIVFTSVLAIVHKEVAASKFLWDKQECLCGAVLFTTGVNELVEKCFVGVGGSPRKLSQDCLLCCFYVRNIPN